MRALQLGARLVYSTLLFTSLSPTISIAFRLYFPPSLNTLFSLFFTLWVTFVNVPLTLDVAKRERSVETSDHVCVRWRHNSWVQYPPKRQTPNKKEIRISPKKVKIFHFIFKVSFDHIFKGWSDDFEASF